MERLAPRSGTSSTVHDRFQEWEQAGFFKALWQDGANRHDVRLLSSTLDGLIISRPEPMEEQSQHLCLDAAYDSTAVRHDLLDRHYIPHIRSRGQGKIEKSTIPGYRAPRWVVERTSPGSIAPDGSRCAGRKRSRTTSPFFTWPALNLSLPS